jgi:hydroxyethylthiazole kinase-like sugar kinase family protein
MNQVTQLNLDIPGPKGRRHESTGKKQFLTMVQDHALINLLLTEYAASGMTDSEFAKYAEDKLKINPGVLKDHTIKMRRDQFKILNNKAVAKAADPHGLAATVLAQDMRISALEERLDMLEGWINTTFPNKGPRKAI